MGAWVWMADLRQAGGDGWWCFRCRPGPKDGQGATMAAAGRRAERATGRRSRGQRAEGDSVGRRPKRSV